MENNNSEEKVIIKYSSYTEAQKRATQKYRQNNKDKVNEQRKKYYKERKEKDPEFLKYKREKAKEYYQKKKADILFNKQEELEKQKELEKELEDIEEEFKSAEPVELFIADTIPANTEDINKVLETIKEEDSDIIETVEVKPKRKYNKKKPTTEPKPELQELPQIPKEIDILLTETIRKRKIIKA